MARADEVGGYIEFERYYGRLFHEDAVKLNCGRSCLAYLIEVRDIKTIWLPDFICSSIVELCLREQVEVKTYSVEANFEPVWNFDVGHDEHLYLIDYYGQLSESCVSQASKRSQGRLIIDEAQNFFAIPRRGIDTIYTARKFFGVADGAFLSTNARLGRELPVDESFDRIRFLLGRFERTASEFFADSKKNNASFAKEPVKHMSSLTENILRSLDYEMIKARRNDNYAFLANVLNPLNELKLREVDGPFAYPLLVDAGNRIREKLTLKKIYVPTLWPNVLIEQSPGSVARRYAQDILPLPVDQRYTLEDMQMILDALMERG